MKQNSIIAHVNQMNKPMKTLSIIIGLLVLPAMVYYQKTIEINGVVFDAEKGTPLMDSHVYISGTEIGTISGEKGEFTLKVPIIYKDRSLIVSYVGYTTFEKKILNVQRNEIQISMQPGIIALDEVIVTPGRGLLIDQAIDQVMTEYDDPDEMLTDFYSALFVLDQDYQALKQVINENLLDE